MSRHINETDDPLRLAAIAEMEEIVKDPAFHAGLDRRLTKVEKGCDKLHKSWRPTRRR